jgi:ribosomal-protein-alanine N-acetyltransferase
MNTDYIVRPMNRKDVTQVASIDREAFPTMWPPMNFYRELENQLASYLVLVEKTAVIEQSDIENEEDGISGKVKRWLTPHGKDQGKIIAFAGFWIMAGEAHIIGVAVKSEYRRQGLGTLILQELIDQAKQRQADCVTLEVRMSNYEAQRLYASLGFVEMGVRRAYYTDNREDAVIMTLKPVASGNKALG